MPYSVPVRSLMTQTLSRITTIVALLGLLTGCAIAPRQVARVGDAPQARATSAGSFPASVRAATMPSGAGPIVSAGILSRLPLHFEANVGQADPRVKFLSRGASHSLLL